MSQEKWTWTVNRILPSRLDAYEVVMEEILYELEKVGWNERDLYAVRLSLEEGLTNAIRHGNGLDSSKQVFVDCRLRVDRVWIEIRDEGEGFDPHEVPDCTEPENLLKESGRGLRLIETFMDSVRYNAVGNSVTLEKWTMRDMDGA